MQKKIGAYGEVSLLGPEKLLDDDWVCAVERIGAPIPVEQRAQVENWNFEAMVCYTISDTQTQNHIKAVMPVEIGGKVTP